MQLDESIKSYEYDKYQPITGTQLNSAGQITITIESQDQFIHNSYLMIEGDVSKADNTRYEGDVSKADNTRYADADLIALTNNRLMFLFSSLKLTLAGQMVEHVNYPGQATSLLGLATYYRDYSKGCGLIQGWTPDINSNAAVAITGFAVCQRFLVQSPDPKCSFQCAIPMRHIFGFTDDYTKVTYGMWDILQLIPKDDNDALCHTAAAGARKVVLSKLAWVVLIVQPNDVLKVNLYKSIAIVDNNDIISLSNQVVNNNDIISLSNQVVNNNDIISLSSQVVNNIDIISLNNQVVNNNDIISLSNQVVNNNDIICLSNQVVNNNDIISLSNQVVNNNDIISLSNQVVNNNDGFIC